VQAGGWKTDQRIARANAVARATPTANTRRRRNEKKLCMRVQPTAQSGRFSGGERERPAARSLVPNDGVQK